MLESANRFSQGATIDCGRSRNQSRSSLMISGCNHRIPGVRKLGDEHLQKGQEGLRMQLAEARAAHAKSDSESRGGKTAQGRQFLQKAKEDMGRGDYGAAVSNLQMALTFEADNAYFKELLEEARSKRG